MALASFEHSIVLVKPEGCTAEVESSLGPLFGEFGLEAICRHRLTVTGDHIRVAWADLSPVDHPLTHTILDLWFRSRTVELVLLTGHDALAKTGRVKSRLRRRFTQGPFRNVVHTPDTATEFSLQVSAFAAGCPRCTGTVPVPVTDPETVPPAFPGGTLLSSHLRTRAAVAPLLTRWWHDPASCFWQPRPLRPGPAAQGAASHAACLERSPHDLSYDNLIAALMNAVPGLDLPAACRVVISALHFRGAPVAYGTAEEMAACRRSLAAQGVMVSVQDTAAPGAQRPAYAGMVE
jgi:hypothetical protein